MFAEAWVVPNTEQSRRCIKYLCMQVRLDARVSHCQVEIQLWLSKNEKSWRGKQSPGRGNKLLMLTCVSVRVDDTPGSRSVQISAPRRRSGGITGRNDGKMWEHSRVCSHAMLLLKDRWGCVRVYVCVVLPHQKLYSLNCFMLQSNQVTALKVTLDFFMGKRKGNIRVL